MKIASRLAVVFALVGCSAKALQVSADSAWTAEQMRCVDKYNAKPEIDACRQAARLRWDAPRDAGSDQ